MFIETKSRIIDEYPIVRRHCGVIATYLQRDWWLCRATHDRIGGTPPFLSSRTSLFLTDNKTQFKHNLL